MKKFIFLPLFLFLLVFQAHSQTSDNFSDGELVSNPAWFGDTAYFIIEDSLLRSKAPEDMNSVYISTPVDEIEEWRLSVHLRFSPSGSNLLRFYLIGDSVNLPNSSNAYFLEIGQTGADQFHLKKVVEGKTVTILSGETLYSGEVKTKIKVIYQENEWKIYLSDDEDYLLDGKAAEPLDFSGAKYAGIYCKYTSTRRERFYFDEFYVGPEIKDLEAPQLISFFTEDNKNIKLVFNESIAPATGENFLLNELYLPEDLVTNKNIVNLSFGVQFREGENQLYIKGINDYSENIIDDTLLLFKYYSVSIPEEGDILINEFMPDPSPIVELPEAEFIELWNRSEKVFDLSQLLINNRPIAQEKMLFMPGSYLILCQEQHVIDFSPYGNLLGMASWDILSNSGDKIVLSEASGSKVIDQVTYTLDWMEDGSRKDGGYSFERINVNFPCNQKFNWSYSSHEAGGSPGAANTVEHEDDVAPKVDYAIATGPNSVVINFSEPLDPISVQLMDYETPEVNFSFIAANEYFDELYLKTESPIKKSTIYSLKVKNVSDCFGNEIIESQISFVLPDSIKQGDIVISEILFDPYPTGEDFVEIYNISNKMLNISDLFITNDTSRIYHISSQPKILRPASYLALTSDTNKVAADYPRHGKLFQIKSMPSMPNEEGEVYLISNSIIIDSVHYHEDQHLKILNSTEGVSLEKIILEELSKNANNWHSAASTVGFATPGLKNSQRLDLPLTEKLISFSAPYFTPNQDGNEDVLIINYSLPSNGIIGSFFIYDPFGNEIAVLANNLTLNTSGNFIWDGITSEGNLAASGHYILIAEMFTVHGELLKVKEKFALIH